MAAVIGALRITLGMDVEQFEKALKAAANTTKSFAKSMSEVAAGIQLQKTLEAVAKGFLNLAVSGLQTGESLNKLSQQIGIPVEELSKLRVAASLSDLSIEEFSKSVVKMSKTLSEATRNPFSEAADAFKTLGVNVRDSSGALKSNDQLLEEIAESISRFRDSAEKTAVVLAIFGRAGASMLPLLNQGRKGIQEAKEEAVAFGVAIDTVTARRAEAFNDNMKRLGFAVEGFVTQITSAALPALLHLSNRFVEIVKDGDLAKTVVSGAISIMQNVATAFVNGAAAVDRYARAIGALVTISINLPFVMIPFSGAIQNIGKAIADWNKGNADAEASTKKLLEEIKNFSAALAGGEQGFVSWNFQLFLMRKELEELEAIARQWLPTMNAMASDETRSKTKAFADQLANLKIEARALKGEFDALPQGFVQAANNFKIFGDVSTKTFAELEPRARSFAFEMLKVSTLKLTQPQSEFLTLQQHITALEAAMKSGKLSTDEMTMATSLMAAAQKKLWESMAEQTAEFAGSMSKLAGVFGKENKAMGIAAKAFGIAQAVINTQLAITKAFATFGPTPVGFVAAAAAAAAGAAAVATIVAQKFAKGGSFMVGGAGGMDSQFIPLALTPGERVDITTPEQQQKQRGGSNVLTVAGLSSREFYRGDVVRDILNGIIEYQRDTGGGRFVVDPIRT